MKELPILFQAAMVRALLAGTKTQTRRICKTQPQIQNANDAAWRDEKADLWRNSLQYARDCSRWHVGDRLFVREGAIQIGHERTGKNGQYLWPKFDDPEKGKRWFDRCCYYTADIHHNHPAWDEPHGTLNKMFMPRWASRITLEVTGVRVERVQQISDADALAEGCRESRERVGNGINWQGARCAYAALWDSINGAGSWESNPFVWVLSFRKI